MPITQEREVHRRLSEQDFKDCETIIRTHSGSFFRAFRHLPADKARAVNAIYAFCRTADDLADVSHDAEGLAALSGELDAFVAGETPPRPFWRALRVVFDRFPMEPEPFFEMIRGQIEDLAAPVYETEAQLEHWCHLVAGSVGGMLLPLLCRKPTPALREAADRLGKAMQLTNILRDIGQDLGNGRVYLATETLSRHGLTRRDLEAGIVDGRFRAMWEDVAAQAEHWYDQSLEVLPLYDPEARLPLYLAAAYYRAILDQVRRNGYDAFRRRARLSDAAKLLLLARCMVFRPHMRKRVAQAASRKDKGE